MDFLTDKLNRKVYRGDIIVSPAGEYFQVVKIDGAFNVWDLGRTPVGRKFDNHWFVQGKFRKVLEKEKR